MGIFLSDTRAETAILVGVGFAIPAVLGGLLVQLMHWDNTLQSRRKGWLAGLDKTTRQLRWLRVKSAALPEFSVMPLPTSLRKKWQVLRWLMTVFSVARKVRS